MKAKPTQPNPEAAPSDQHQPSPMLALAPPIPSTAAAADTDAENHDDAARADKTRATTTMADLPLAPRPFPRDLRRLRDRLQAREDRLLLDVNGLQQEIVDLNVQRLVINTKRAVKRRLLLQKSVEVVVEYFGAFQHGWILEAATTDQHIAELQATVGDRSFAMIRSPRQDSEQAAFLRERQRLLMDRQQHFVRTALDPMMTFGTAHSGLDAFVDQWQKYSAHHRMPRLTLTCMTCHGSADEPIVIALSTFSGTLTHKALAEKFPHSLTDPRIMKRLIGASIQYPSREIFHFSNTGLIKRYDRGIDYVHAFASILGNLEDVSTVLHDAMLWDDGADTRTHAMAAATPVLLTYDPEKEPMEASPTRGREERDVA